MSHARNPTLWRGYGCTHIGRVRTVNQDYHAVLDRERLWLVADGMGGRPGGDVASRVASTTFITQWRADAARDARPAPLKVGITRLTTAVRAAHDAVRREAERRPSLAGMGTTLVALTITPGPDPQLLVAHVGDSRAYRLRHGEFSALTRDHSFVEESCRMGRLTQDQAVDHPLRHVLTRAVGTDSTVEADIGWWPVEPHDQYLLCSDGLTKMLGDPEIHLILADAARSADETCRALVEEANDRGGYDNITVVLVRNELTTNL